MNILKKNIFLIFLFLLLIFFKGSIITTLITSFVQIQLEFILNNTELGLIATLFYFFSCIGSIFWTYLMGIFSRLKLYFMGVFFVLLGCIILYLTTDYLMLLLGSSITGFGVECFTIVLFNSYTDLVGESKRSTFISIFFMSQGAGGLLGVFLAGSLEGAYNFHWSTLFLILGIFLLVINVIFLLFSKKIKRTIILSTAEPVDGDGLNFLFKKMNEKISKKLIRNIFANRINLYLFLFSLIFFPVQQIYNIWLQKYWIEIHHLSQIQASISYIFTSGGEFLGIIFGGLLIDKLKSKFTHVIYAALVNSVISTSMFLMGFSIPWILTTTFEGTSLIESIFPLLNYVLNNPPVLWFYILLFLGFFFLQYITPFIPVIVLESNSKETKAVFINIIIFSMNLGLLSGPIIGGFLGDFFGLDFVLLIPPIAILIGGLLFLLILKEYQKRRHI